MRTKGDGTLYKDARGYWVGGVQLPPGPDGKRRYKKVVRKDYNDCLAALRKLRKELDDGTIALSPKTTVGKWCDYWITDLLPHKKIKPSTVAGYRNTVKNYIKPRIGTKRLDKLTPADVRNLYTDLQAHVSPRAAQKADQVLRLAYKAAIRDSIVGKNIMAKVDKPPHTPAPQQAFGAKVSMLIIATAIETQGRMWGARWALGFTTGARESEVLGLEWDRVDLDEGVIDIAWQLKREQKVHGCGDPVDGKYPCGKERMSFCPQARWEFPSWLEWRHCEGTLVFTKPKTRAGQRLVPVIPDMIPVLRDLRDITPNPHGLVFHHDDGSPFSTEDDQAQWKALLKSAGLPHARQHSIRHSTATLLMEYGVSEHVIASVIGHTDTATTRGYLHVDLSLARDAWAQLGALLPPTSM